MSDWKEKLMQLKKYLIQQPEKKREDNHITPAAAVDRKVSSPILDEKLFLEAMKQEGVDPIPEFIAMEPEHRAKKRVVLKLKDLPAGPEVRRYMTGPQRKQEWERSSPAQKSTSTVLPPEIPMGKNRITIGIDFGTSTTKVCARTELGGNDVPVYRIDISDDATAWEGFTPSLVSIDKGSLYFADHVQQGTAIPHLKVCLACEKRQFDRKECLWADACPISTSGSGLAALDLATLYLSWAMNKSRKRLPDALKKAGGFVFNVGVPLKQLDDSPLKAVYERISYFAWRLSEGVKQGLSIAQAKVWLDILNQQYGTMPPPEDRMIQICPETSAAIVSFVNSSSALPGLYCLCDIGAWTSDISVFRLTDIAKPETGVDRLSFYASGVTRSACEEIDTRIVHCLTELWGSGIKDFLSTDILSEIRCVREHQEPSATFSVSTESGLQRERNVPPFVLDYARNVVAEAVGRYFVKITKQAYQEKERVPDRWREVSLVMTGGGSRDIIFEKVFSENCGCHFKKVILNVDVILNAPKEQHFRFAVAAGLSHPLATWPEQLLPSEVSSWQPHAVKQIADRDEQYPK